MKFQFYLIVTKLFYFRLLNKITCGFCGFKLTQHMLLYMHVFVSICVLILFADYDCQFFGLNLFVLEDNNSNVFSAKIVDWDDGYL